MLSNKQKEFLLNPLHRINLLYGSVRSGKTWISLLAWALWVGQQPKDKEFLMVGRTLTTLKRNCLGVLQTLIGDNVQYSISQKEGTIFGRKVWLEGANDSQSESKIRGMTLQGVYIDELTQIPRDFYMMSLSRLSEKNAVLIATTNPDHPDHYVKTDIIDNDVIDKQVVKFLLDDNIYLDEDYKRNLIAEYQSMSKFYYQRFVLGEFVRAEGLVFPEFAERPTDHLTADKPQSFLWCEVGFDIGGNGSAYALTASAMGNDRNLYVLKSKKIQADAIRMQDIERMVTEFCKSVESKYNVRINYINSDHIAAIINTLNDNTPFRTGLTYKPALVDRPFVISKLLAEKRLCFMEGECEDLIDELCNLTFDSKSTEAIPLDDGTMQIDTWDSFIYSLSGNWNYIQ